MGGGGSKSRTTERVSLLLPAVVTGIFVTIRITNSTPPLFARVGAFNFRNEEDLK